MKKGKRELVIGIGFILLMLGIVFLIDYFQTQNLLRNGIHANATVTDRYFEINTDTKDTTSYSMRMTVIPDTMHSKNSFPFGDRLSAIVKKESFYKYSEGTIVKVAYKKNDLDHAKLIEEIE